MKVKFRCKFRVKLCRKDDIGGQHFSLGAGAGVLHCGGALSMHDKKWHLCQDLMSFSLVIYTLDSIDHESRSGLNLTC